MLWITLLKIFANRLLIRAAIALSSNCKKNEQLKIITIKQYVTPIGASAPWNGIRPQYGTTFPPGRLCIAHKASGRSGTAQPHATTGFYAFLVILRHTVNR
jgi:hypothetical protein